MSYLQLPPVHGYGVPQILSQWQAGQDRRQQKEQFQKEFGLREKQFEFQQEQFKEEKAAKNQLRQAKAQDNAFKFIDTGEKYMGDDKTFQTGVSMSDKGYKMLNEIYPGLNIDVSNIVDAKERKKEAQKQMILGLTELQKRAVGGDEKAIALMPGALAGASSAGIEKTTLDFLKDYKPEGVGEEGKTYQLKIKDLMKQNPELSQQEATGLMTGTIKVMQDPVSGARFVVDTIKGTERQLKPEGLAKQPPKETGPQDKTIFELADLVSGPGSALKAAASVPSGIVGGPVADETLQARQYVVTAKNDLIRALSINPRFPVGEIKRIEQEIDVSPKILDNPKMLKNRLISIDKYLKRRVEKEKGVANDANMPTNARQEAMSSVKDIENFIKLMGVPIQIKSIEEYNTVESGTQYIDPDGKVRTKK
jgi:hypothetical protein